jgi:hypothetical protein
MHELFDKVVQVNLQFLEAQPDGDKTGIDLNKSAMTSRFVQKNGYGKTVSALNDNGNGFPSGRR